MKVTAAAGETGQRRSCIRAVTRGGPSPALTPPGRPRPHARTHSTWAHRAQATAPQLQQVRTQRAHRARSHWPHAAFPSTARTHEEQAPDAAPAGSVRKKHRSAQW